MVDGKKDGVPSTTNNGNYMVQLKIQKFPNFQISNTLSNLREVHFEVVIEMYCGLFIILIVFVTVSVVGIDVVVWGQ